MIGQTAGDAAAFLAGSVLSLAMVVYFVKEVASQRHGSKLVSFVRGGFKAVRSSISSSAEVDEVDRIVQEKMRRQKVVHFRAASKTAGVLISPFTVLMMLNIASGGPRRHTATQDACALIAQGLSMVTLFRPGFVNNRSMDVLYVITGLILALYVSPLAARVGSTLETLVVTDMCAIGLTTVRRSLPACAAMNTVITVSACCLAWARRGTEVSWPHSAILVQALAMACITACNQLLDRSVASTIRQGLETQAAKEVLSAATALLKSCCDVVVELDSEGTILGQARDLSSFLLRGAGSSLQGALLADLMAGEEDRLFFAGKLREPWPDGASLAEVRHVHMKDGNGETLPLELLWFQFRHLDQRMRYMVGLKEFSDPALRRPPPPSSDVKGKASSPKPPAGAEEDAGGSIPEASSLVSGPISGPALVVVDSTQDDHPVRETSAEFTKRVGRVALGQSFVSLLRDGGRFKAWLQMAIQISFYMDEAAPDVRLILRMPQGDMTTTCRLVSNLDPDSADEAPDLRRVELSFFDIRRRCGSSTTSERNYLKGTPVKRLAL